MPYNQIHSKRFFVSRSFIVIELLNDKEECNVITEVLHCTLRYRINKELTNNVTNNDDNNNKIIIKPNITSIRNYSQVRYIYGGIINTENISMLELYLMIVVNEELLENYLIKSN
ncbi:hypothetical protein Glove_294g132 [Diversispora epigaea]|uniref:BTB domain-containing protein n=1 Tax=Diversispora epigaea TaxID=1348612 RepID=A0A397I2Z5_9GLOM|nr:hypothetical protein Glove_294g132 [Diversispora epigaea]